MKCEVDRYKLIKISTEVMNKSITIEHYDKDPIYGGRSPIRGYRCNYCGAYSNSLEWFEHYEDCQTILAKEMLDGI